MNFTRFNINLFGFLLCFLVISCNSKKVKYSSVNDILASKKVKLSKKYLLQEENGETTPEDLISITEYNIKGNKEKELTINSYTKDTATWDYIYNDQHVLTNELGKYDMYPIEVYHTYNEKGVLIKTKMGGAEARDISYTYHDNGLLKYEISLAVIPTDNPDSIVWETIDSTHYYYKDGLLSNKVFYYRDKVMSDTHFENYNDSGQCLLEKEYNGDEVESTLEYIYNDDKLLSTLIHHDFLNNKKTFYKILYEFFP